MSTKHKPGLDKHICKEDKTCCCSLTALEPDEDCPVHGWPYPSRCRCGRFVKSKWKLELKPEISVNERVAQLIAHRACGNQEQDAENGKLSGYCVICQVPWPCEIAKPQCTS